MRHGSNACLLLLPPSRVAVVIILATAVDSNCTDAVAATAHRIFIYTETVSNAHTITCNVATRLIAHTIRR